jgi:hypothetical protein
LPGRAVSIVHVALPYGEELKPFFSWMFNFPRIRCYIEVAPCAEVEGGASMTMLTNWPISLPLHVLSLPVPVVLRSELLDIIFQSVDVAIVQVIPSAKLVAQLRNFHT